MTVIQDHANAVLGLLTASVPGSTRVLDGFVPVGTVRPYLLVYMFQLTPDAGQAPDAVSFTYDSDVIDWRVYCHSVADNGAAARAVAGQARAALLNVTPVIAGRQCFPIRHREGMPPQRDEETGVLVMDLVDVYGFRSVPG